MPKIKSLMDRRDAAFKAARDFQSTHADEMSADELKEFEVLLKEVETIDSQIETVNNTKAASDRLSRLTNDDQTVGEDGGERQAMAKSIGDHFVMEAGAAGILKKQADGAHIDFSSTEYPMDGVKAASSPFALTEARTGDFLTGFDRTIVNQRRRELIVSDLMSQVQTTNSTIKYLREKVTAILEGAAATVAEGGKKPYIRYDEFDIVAESLTKVAALSKITDETLEDAPFVADWINTRLIYDLSVLEEEQLINGDGTGSNIVGLMQRSGVQSLAATSKADWAETIRRSFRLVRRGSPYRVDGILMNDEDYDDIALTKDANGQYFAGGPFQNQYGNGAFEMEAPLWGKKTIPVDFLERGTALVGAFYQGATVLRKGGLRVDSVATNVDDFEHNLITLRAEERMGLMVPIPAAFVKISLTDTAIIP